ncbi:MAG: hypothetical protein KZQ94_20770 [Candidatus Thiodiazotropha sp. (ex Troendleina suluensis)]|nr:hypothetical protein [Candidatus Thiodiazotropha sp. (ex Troendleina suluensis)]
MTAYCAPTVLRTSRFRIAQRQQAARALLHHDSRNDSTASRMRSLYALHRSLSVTIPATQPRLRLSGTIRLVLRTSMADSDRISTSTASQPREGFTQLLADAVSDQVGLILNREVSRLSRSDKDGC